MRDCHAMTPIASTPEVWTDERCFIRELLNTAADPACSIAQARVPPGTTTQLHALRGITERYVVLQGTGIARIGDQPEIRLGAGATRVIAAGEPQQVANRGNDDLIFLCICTPRFTRDAYVNLET